MILKKRSSYLKSNEILLYRTDVWAIGCLLFAWYYGYSPFECEFIENTSNVRVVECTHLRVLSKVPSPTKKTMDDILTDKKRNGLICKLLECDQLVTNSFLKLMNLKWPQWKALT